jgi:hypothetical protein
MSQKPDRDDMPPAVQADRWGGRWSGQGLTLSLANGQIGTALRLEPPTVAALAHKLSLAVAELENTSGTLWSEHHAALGAITDARLDVSEAIEANPLARRLYLLFRNLPLQGFERSFKLLDGSLWSRRFLVGIQSTRLAPEDFVFLSRQMGAPLSVQKAMAAGLQDASFVHIGFEQAGDHSVYKLYLEHPAAAQADGGIRPLYIGYKWDPDDNARCAVSRYTQPEAMALPDVLDKTAMAYAGQDPPVQRIAREIIWEAGSRAAANQLLFVEVVEDGTSRASFDINLYEARMTVSELQAPLQALSQHLGISAQVFVPFMRSVRADRVGHLSGGTDRHGRAFLTVYHAKQPKAPPAP